MLCVLKKTEKLHKNIANSPLWHNLFKKNIVQFESIEM